MQHVHGEGLPCGGWCGRWERHRWDLCPRGPFFSVLAARECLASHSITLWLVNPSIYWAPAVFPGTALSSETTVCCQSREMLGGLFKIVQDVKPKSFSTFLKGQDSKCCWFYYVTTQPDHFSMNTPYLVCKWMSMAVSQWNGIYKNWHQAEFCLLATACQPLIAKDYTPNT